MHIACNIDNNYVMQCCTTLVSVLYNNRQENISFHIISDGLREEYKQKIIDQVEAYGQKVCFYDIDKKLQQGLPSFSSAHISIAAYYRLFVTEVLPKNLHKVLYLDCDLIVNTSIRTLMDINVDGYALAAVEDMWSARKDNYKRLGYDAQYTYFNSGVLIINLDYWRDCNCVQQSLAYIQENAENLIFNDQDVLNGLFHDQKLLLPFRWNIQDGFLRRKKKIRQQVIGSLREELKHPAIIHFTGHRKPWMHICLNPYKDLFFKYVDMTEWKGFRPHAPLSWKVKQVIDAILYTLHLKPQKYDAII